MTVNYRTGHISVPRAARALRVSRPTVLRLLRWGMLHGGHYANKERGRYVRVDSVVHLLRRRVVQAVTNLKE